MSPTDLSPDSVKAKLHTHRIGRAYELVSRCASTNDEVAARAAGDAAHGLVIAAEEQTGGRGRRGRSWHSPAGQNLTFSVLLRPLLPPHRIAPVSLLVGVAVARALSALGFSPRLKWPNDVLLAGQGALRKVAGVLAEMASDNTTVRHVVVGVGINVNGRAFPPELASRATSLALTRDEQLGATGTTLDRGLVLATFLDAFEPLYDRFLSLGPQAGLLEWRQHAILGQACFVERGERRLEGIAVGIDETGALLMKTDQGEVAVHAGEVNWLSAR